MCPKLIHLPESLLAASRSCRERQSVARRGRVELQAEVKPAQEEEWKRNVNANWKKILHKQHVLGAADTLVAASNGVYFYLAKIYHLTIVFS